MNSTPDSQYTPVNRADKSVSDISGITARTLDDIMTPKKRSAAASSSGTLNSVQETAKAESAPVTPKVKQSATKPSTLNGIGMGQIKKAKPGQLPP